MKEFWPKVPIAELAAGYEILPGSPYEKRRLMAVLLRCRIERVVIDLPSSVVKGPGRPDRVRTRLVASVGEPGLTDEARVVRLAVALRAARTYETLCTVLHGDHTSLYPSIHDITAWSAEVVALERHFAPPDDITERAGFASATV